MSLAEYNEKNLNEEQLYAIVEEYPYYHLAQFWLLANQSKMHTEFPEKQTSKTALFFCNHMWLKYQLDIQNKIKSEAPDSKENNVESIFKTTISLSLNSHDKAEKKEDIVIPFEPLHTVDYFASQGIRINEELIPNDKLGSQLKSFTEWLKSMKKIHPQNLSPADEHTDKKIQNIAETSNTKTEVITESMAEILTRQGKIEKAVDVYRKLSLNNPSKSAYFAAKIQSLKPK